MTGRRLSSRFSAARPGVGLHRMAPTLGLVLVAVVLGPVPIPPAMAQTVTSGAAAEDPAALLQEANQLYQENRFGEARDGYLAILDAGYESGDLYYNLGNAWFKTGSLPRAILNYERALRLDPGNPDTRANLELARSLTADAIEPMPRFWLLSALDWWVNLLPGVVLAALVALAWVAITAGLCIRILGRRPGARPLGGWIAMSGAAVLLLFGVTLLAREGFLGETEWGIIMSEEVAVQSAPSAEDDLTLFNVHEGTKVRLDQRTEEWSEVVLEDGRVGWVPTECVEEI